MSKHAMKLYEVGYQKKLTCDRVFAAYVNFDEDFSGPIQAAISIYEENNIRYFTSIMVGGKL